ncbi:MULTISPECIES: hypothetical protein [Streptomyces]|nr:MULTISPECIES: hypothetical protein [Streptomyces]MBQ0953074.1 hypothetical protein [Streptomyces sp. RK76]MDI6521618.1 hypothetical protein [Streptomyces coelicoflavus]
MLARMAAMTALALEVPMEGMSALTPLADAVSVTGTESMIRVGRAA